MRKAGEFDVAKPKKDTTEASTEAKKSHNGVYIIGALVAAALAVGLYFSSGETAADLMPPRQIRNWPLCWKRGRWKTSCSAIPTRTT
ncbi:hypothetical protein AUC70_03805 [Methyloceanibacter stevinii]|uniref:Uncharacterized protein n=1 Tax=Methyloceanibacter stevinii TaxID=1774970 RepID=A0A1E3VN12_9HYPH|nr:hypothetical protein [Methyloceanibacter stevinii]ODR94920.1 hypothetical protein AUC70_03805 [Methyloceanibacter stevinii]